LALRKFGNIGFDPEARGQSLSANLSGETNGPRIGAAGPDPGQLR
jgi:hypothetical protein